jgi:molecular chaperone GrpE (heat shock protein)
MSDRSVPQLPKWPFLLGDLALLGLAAWLISRNAGPLQLWEAAALVLCVGGGAWLAVTPFIAEYRAAVKLAEADHLAETVAKIQQLESVATQVASCTNQWTFAQEQANKSVEAAKAISDRMNAEMKSFTEFMQRTNDTEKATLRLEVEKLRRTEGDWLQILVRIHDHIYALHQAGARSGQPALIEQLTMFSKACLDATRRVGLVPFAAAPDEPFDARMHQAMDDGAEAPPNAVVTETLATGYTFQGQLLRRAVVNYRVNGALQSEAAPRPAERTSGSAQDEPHPN